MIIYSWICDCCVYAFDFISIDHSKSRLRNPQFGSSFNGQEGFKIVVEESNIGDDIAASTSSTNHSTPRDSLEIGSPLNPYLLSPWRETRKHSLPSQQVTEGITASQVRRLSERGGEGSGPSPKVFSIFIFLLTDMRESMSRVFFPFIIINLLFHLFFFCLCIPAFLPPFFYSLRLSLSFQTFIPFIIKLRTFSI